jgi:hypothetical protein
MQWIFMLAGLLLGAAVAESLSGAILSGLLGLTIAQTLKVRSLEFQQGPCAKSCRPLSGVLS